jgi:regulator of protease activity HflC (stomatin/prohibitin superfamily)
MQGHVDLSQGRQTYLHHRAHARFRRIAVARGADGAGSSSRLCTRSNHSDKKWKRHGFELRSRHSRCRTAALVLGSLRVLRQYERGVVFLLGKFSGVREPGLRVIFAPIQQMVRVSLRTVTMQIPSQKIITKDNVSIDIAAVAYYHISDPEKSVIVIENVYNAINQISQTTVRNVVGRFSLDQLLSDTASINLQIKNVIDGHTEPWGTQVTAVEIKDIMLPDNMQRAMAKEAEAERPSVAPRSSPPRENTRPR